MLFYLVVTNEYMFRIMFNVTDLRMNKHSCSCIYIYIAYSSFYTYIQTAHPIVKENLSSLVMFLKEGIKKNVLRI